MNCSKDAECRRHACVEQDLVGCHGIRTYRCTQGKVAARCLAGIGKGRGLVAADGWLALMSLSWVTGKPASRIQRLLQHAQQISRDALKP